MAETLRSIDPASGEVLWEQPVTSAEECTAQLATARARLAAWSRTPLAERIAVARRYAELLEARRETIAEAISRESGKLLWETRGELGSMISKVAVSTQAQAERAGQRKAATAFGHAVLRHRPHGVMAVLGPYNFPGHLPNGHIVPALLAGNTVVFKPSEEAPWTGELMAQAWHDAGLPEGVFGLVQGGRETGAALVAGDIDGLLFTGSAEAGAYFRRAFVDRPHVILALELGGNNPLIAWDGEPEALATTIIQSAFITTGQRCSCARRLIVPEGLDGDAIVDALATRTGSIRVGAWFEKVDAYIGPMISGRAAANARGAVERMVALGAKPIRPFAGIAGRNPAFVTPGLYDATGVAVPDAEIFAPVLQIYRVADFDAAVRTANATVFGLAAGLLTADDALWERFLEGARAGIVNRNRPTTGAAANMPFGALGASGNHRPSAYYAADYCAYPMASFEADNVVAETLPGVG
jgi:succinylglutamic semialdehyde dehydrogenase